jgi:6,7-dimethyl-8-ribityllumazine synthase
MLQEQQTLAYDKKFTKKLKIAIVRPNYHTELVDSLEAFARGTLITAGVIEKNITTFRVPGSWEIPILVQKVAESKKYDAIIALGVIVKGETFHFELIANEVTSALMSLSIDNRLPIAYEILAVSDIRHAQARAGRDTNNKGIEAANAVLQTLLTLKRIKK